MSRWANKTLVLATHNKGKVAEISAYLEPFRMNIITAASLQLPEPVETENTFEGNALLKARAAVKSCGHMVLADDSGLMINALNGDPGVYSADWAGVEKDFSKAIARVENEMVGTKDFSAKFVTAMVLADESGSEIITRGEVNGMITFPPRGSDGFGYDPIFIPDGETRTFGEMTLVEKKTLSHRTNALQKLIDIMSAS